jgi:Flp pilus assembly protein TadG
MTSCVCIGEAVMTGFLHHLQSFRSDRSGSVATEIAVATPFLVFLTAGIIEYGSMLRSTELMQTGVRDAARYLASMPGLPVAPTATRSSIEQRARLLATTGMITTGGTPRVRDWTTAGVQVTYEPIANPRDDASGLRQHRGDDNIYIVRVTGTMNYTGIGMLRTLGIGPVAVTAAHEERHVAI